MLSRKKMLGIGLQLALLTSGCGASGTRAIDESSAPLTESRSTSADFGADLQNHANDRANTLSYGIAQADFIGHVVVSRIEGRLGTMGRAAAPAIWSKVEFKVLHAVKRRRTPEV